MIRKLMISDFEKRLFRQIQDTASEIGAERMDLMVWAFNAPALAFYKSLGMKEQRIVLEKQVKERTDAICVFYIRNDNKKHTGSPGVFCFCGFGDGGGMSKKGVKPF